VPALKGRRASRMRALSRAAGSGLGPNAIRSPADGVSEAQIMTFTLARICPVGMPDRLDSTVGLAISEHSRGGHDDHGSVGVGEEVAG
jgi:hypothetical protein